MWINKVIINSEVDLNVSYDGVYGGKVLYILEVILEVLEVFVDINWIFFCFRG